MRDPIGYHKASTMAAEIINAAAIAGQKTPPGKLLEDAHSLISKGFSVTFERCYGIDAHLHVGFRRAFVTKNEIEGEVEGLAPNVEITWSSSRRDPLTVIACLALYEQVAKVAALIQVTLERETILDREVATMGDLRRGQ
jgi:hypothetical protein